VAEACATVSRVGGLLSQVRSDPERAWHFGEKVFQATIKVQ